MTYTRDQLIKALQHEYDYLIHDSYDPDVDLTPEDHLDWLKSMSYDELVEETSTDGIFTLDEFMHNHL